MADKARWLKRGQGALAEGRLGERGGARQAQTAAQVPQLLAAVHGGHQELPQRRARRVGAQAHHHIAVLPLKAPAGLLCSSPWTGSWQHACCWCSKGDTRSMLASKHTRF